MGALVTLAGIFLVGLVVGLSQDAGAGAVGWTVLSLFPTLLCSAAIAQFFAGRWIARRAPGRELPACLALAMLQLVVAWAVPVALALATHDKQWLVSALESLWFQLTVVFCFLGALLVRRRASRTAG